MTTALLEVFTLADSKGRPLMVPVTILDERMAYGRQDVLITPVSGTGQAWVSADRVKVGKER